MSSAAVQTRYTPELYLALETQNRRQKRVPQRPGHCHGWGQPAAQPDCRNFYREVSQQLRGRPCEAYISAMRVQVSRTGFYTYPDVAVVCGDSRFADVDNDTLLNPTIIVEVLSASTEAYDRGEKFAHYRRLESLQEYLLVAQDKVRIEHYVRQGTTWVLSELSDLNDTVPLATIDCAIALRDVYDKVQFAGNAETPSPRRGMEPTR